MSDDELRALERRAATGGEGDVLAWQIALLRTRGRLDTIHRELWLAAPPAEVRRLFESVALEDFRGEPVPGAELTLVRRPGAHESRVDLAFMDERGGTRVRVIESGFGTGPHWDWRYRDRDRQWDAALTKLFAAVELPGAASLVRGTELRLGHEEAWAAIATAPGLARWLCADAEVADDVGGPVRLRIDGDSLRGTVRERLPGRALAVALQPDSATEAPPTLLTFSLVPGTDRTGVVVVKTGQWRDGDVSSLDAAIRNLASVHGRHVDLRGRVVKQELVVKSVLFGPTPRQKRNRDRRSPPCEPERRVVLSELDAWRLFNTTDGLARWLLPGAAGTLERGRDLEIGDAGAAVLWRYEGESVTDISAGPERPAALASRGVSFTTHGLGSSTAVELSMTIMSDGTLRFEAREEGLGDGTSDAALREREQEWARRFERLRLALETDWPECREGGPDP